MEDALASLEAGAFSQEHDVQDDDGFDPSNSLGAALVAAEQ